MHQEQTVGRFARLAAFAVRRAVWVLLGWLLVAGVLNVAVPQLEDVAARDSTPVVPTYAPSIEAVHAMDRAFGSGRSHSFLVIAMEREGGLTRADTAYARHLVTELRADDDVAFVQDVRRSPELLKALTSRDGEARYVQVGITGDTGAPSSIQQVEAVRSTVRAHAPPGLRVEVTGPTATIVDVATGIEHSLLRITIVTVLVIAVILLVIYRSFVVTGLVLGMVGLGLGLARAVTSLLGISGVLEVSTFTGSFVTGVVLGAGTDYAIFLISRYHEQRRLGVPPAMAARVAGTRVGGVIAASALTVMLGTACLAFADLGFFRTTGPALAVSVAVDLVLSLTLLPALLALAGARGWAEPRSAGHPRFWNALTGLVVAAPARMLAVALVPLLALALCYPLLETSFDERGVQPDDTESNQGYALLARHFPINEVLPDFVLVTADHDLRNARDLALLEQAAGAVAGRDGVDLVRGITRPLGHPITRASVGYQAGVVGDRLQDASRRVASGEEGASALVDGAGRLDQGAGRLADGAGRLGDGARQAVAGSGRLVDGTEQLAAGIDRILAGVPAAVDGSDRVAAGMGDLADGLQAAHDQTAVAVDGLGLAYDALSTKSLTCGLDPACRQARDGIRQIWVAERDRLLPALQRAADAARRLADGTVGLHAGLTRLRSALQQVRDGADRLRQGQQQFGRRLGDLASGADRLADGAGRLSAGADRVEGGTEQVAQSLPELRRGMERAAAYLHRTGAVARDPAVGGFYLPPAALDDPRFAAASGLYLSEDGRTARLMVLGSTDAFGRAAAQRSDDIHQAVVDALAGTRLEDATVQSTGMASTNADLAHYASTDLRLVALLALLAVFLVLLVVLRSLVAAVLLLGTVVLSYVSAIGLATLVWQVLLDKPLEWSVPALTLVLLVAVGADYNLLLTKRIHEEAPDGAAAGIARATVVTGGVITSAGLIFAGSMLALMAGSILTLAQMGFTIGAGLLLDTFLVRSLLVPAAATLLGPRLWWPGHPSTRH
ncbi:MAG TPA: MMPL family transporter [Nocardioides sp.]|nr:MMPL family transporter [Nocardioides sp.]